MNPLEHFSVDTNGDVSSPESRREDLERRLQKWRDEWKRDREMICSFFPSRNEARSREATKEQSSSTVAAAMIFTAILVAIAAVAWRLM